MIALSPVPADISPYYPKSYYTIPASLAELEAISRPERYKIELIRPFARPGKLLEMGPAWGSFASLAKQAGFDVDVIERDSQCRRFLTETVGVNVINKGENDEHAALKNAGTYDVIALWHVLEHLSDPWKTLDILVEKLNRGGCLIIATPNPDSFQRYVFKSRWTHIDAPRHMTLIPVGWLKKTLAAKGVRPVLATTTDAGDKGWNRFGWKFSSANMLPKKLSLAGKAFGLILSGIAAPLESRAWLGACYTLILKRDE